MIKHSFRARSGIDTGGGNGIFWIKIIEKLPNNKLLIENTPSSGRKELPTYQCSIEDSLVYPLLRGKDVERWKICPSMHIIVPHTRLTGMEAITEHIMKIRHPKTYDFFIHFKDNIKARNTLKIFGGSTKYWYSLFKIGKYTFSNHKVVWREISTDFMACAISSIDDRFLGTKLVVPDHKLMLIPCTSQNEAYFLSGILNSSVARTLVKSYAVETQISTHVLKYLKIPSFDSQNAIHKKIVKISKTAHDFAQSNKPDSLKDTENKLDETVALGLYNLETKELEALKESLNILLGN